MREWLYKATDRENEAGRRRPDFEATQALAVEDRIVCRGAYIRGGHRRVNLVWRVAVGDVLHVYHRQWAEGRGFQFIGSFRVADPGEALFDAGCALARVVLPSLAQRLQDLYDIPREDAVTGWIVEPARDVAMPIDGDQLRWFRDGRNTLVTYHPEAARPPQPRRPKDEVAHDLIEWHFRIGREITEIYRFYDERAEERSDEPIKLLEVTPESSETGSVDTFGFDPRDDITYPSAVGMITPHELELIRRGDLDLPPGWDWSTARRFLREEFPCALEEGAA
jgi:hypothetical protein